MEVATREEKRRRPEEEEEEEEGLENQDHISRLPDGVLGDIVSLLPTKDGARTQVLSPRWRHIWRSAPLNVHIHGPDGCFTPVEDISRILSAHPGPGRRFSIPIVHAAGTLDGWLQSPALNDLQELEFHLVLPRRDLPPPPLPASARRFSGTLRAVSFGGCCFPDGDAAGALHLPLLKKLSLVDVRISEASLQALLAGCPVLESLLLLDNYGCPRVRIVSPSLRSIGVRSDWRDLRLQELIIEDAPCLERLLYFSGAKVDISIISAPRLDVLGHLSGNYPGLQFGTTGFHQRPRVVSNLAAVLRGVKVLALRTLILSLNAVIDLLKCSPHLETLYIETRQGAHKNVRCQLHRDLIGTPNIRLKKIVLTNYGGNLSHINFATFFVLNARLLESMRFELEAGEVSEAWIERQRSLLQIEKRASRGAQFYLVPRNIWIGSSSLPCAEQVHDLSTADPFQRLHA